MNVERMLLRNSHSRKSLIIAAILMIIFMAFNFMLSFKCNFAMCSYSNGQITKLLIDSPDIKIKLSAL
jgi:hypothetical protein